MLAVVALDTFTRRICRAQDTLQLYVIIERFLAQHAESIDATLVPFFSPVALINAELAFGGFLPRYLRPDLVFLSYTEHEEDASTMMMDTQQKLVHISALLSCGLLKALQENNPFHIQRSMVKTYCDLYIELVINGNTNTCD